VKKIRRKSHYTYEEKKHVLERYLLSGEYEGIGRRKFAKICGLSYTTFHSWGVSIDWDGSRIEELRKKKRKRKTREESGLGAGVETKILELKNEHRNWGPLKIKQYLWRHDQIVVPQTSIYKFLKREGLVKERKPEQERAPRTGNFEYEYPLACVQMDLMHLVLSSGLTIYLVTLLDDFSRFVLLSRFIGVRTMDKVIEMLRETVRKYGVMDALLTDCGTEFVAWNRFTRFEDLLVDLDVRYVASGPNKKENQGKVERWHQTIREALRLRGPLDFSSEAQLWIQQLVNMYNYERPHQGIGGLLPADRFFGMEEEIEIELERCRRSQKSDRQIYMVCRIGGRKLVVSGQRSEELTVLLDGKSIGTEERKKKNRLEKKAVEGHDDNA